MFLNKFFFSFSIFLLVSLLHLASPGYAERKDSEEQAGSPSNRAVQVRSTQHLLTPEDHSNFLIDALNSAKKSVMICSYNLDPGHLLETGIARAIKKAYERSVTVYIYYNKIQCDYPMVDAHLSQLRSISRLAQNTNHAKSVIQDNERVAIGSHNWLSRPWEGSLNASWVISGDFAKDVSKHVWRGVRFHQSLAHENEQGVRGFFRNEDNFCFEEAEFDPGQTFYAMGTPEAHHQFLDSEVFRKAQSNIVLCSPFIRLERLKEVLSKERLKDLRKRNIRLFVVTSLDPCSRTPQEKGPIFQYLEYLKGKFGNFSFRTQEGLHAKSLIVDEELLLEGSFNWLSAVDSSLHDANNNEVSVAIRGIGARKMIKRSQQDPQWKRLFPSSSSSTEQKARKRKREDMLGGDAKRRKSTSPQSPQEDQRYASRVETFSGKRFGREGFCARVDGDIYILDEKNRTLYFNTPEEARQAAYTVLAGEEESEASSSDEEEIPERFLNQIQVFPDNRGNLGYCVRRFREYLTDGRSILYFSTPEEAEYAAYQTWG